MIIAFSMYTLFSRLHSRREQIRMSTTLETTMFKDKDIDLFFEAKNVNPERTTQKFQKSKVTTPT